MLPQMRQGHVRVRQQQQLWELQHRLQRVHVQTSQPCRVLLLPPPLSLTATSGCRGCVRAA
jgi:hypothetical protein